MIRVATLDFDKCLRLAISTSFSSANFVILITF